MQAQNDIGSEKISMATVAHTGEKSYRKIGYARVSTRDQALDLQIDALLRDGVPDDAIYRETASANSKRRPEFTKMMREIRSGDMIVTWKPDRLFRSLREWIKFVEELERRDAQLRILTQISLDTSTASGRLTMGLLMLVAEFEADLTHERTMAGLRSAKARGRVGGARPTYSDEQIIAAVKLYDAGATWEEAAATVIAQRGKRKGNVITPTRLRARAAALKEKDENVRECA